MNHRINHQIGQADDRRVRGEDADHDRVLTVDDGSAPDNAQAWLPIAKSRAEPAMV